MNDFTDNTGKAGTDTTGEAGNRTFSQDDVNRIVGERLAKEKAKTDAAIADREQELVKREALLNARDALTARGLPVELADCLQLSTPEDLKKNLDFIQNYIEKRTEQQRQMPPKGAYYAGNGSKAGNPLKGDDDVRKAFGLQK